MIDQTNRLGLPLLFSGQAQKEVTHNEALFLIDGATQPDVEGVSATPITNLAETDQGKSWLVGSNPQASWSDQANNIAIWNGGSWRFIRAKEGMLLFRRDISQFSIYKNAAWFTAATISGPTGGSVIDIEARAKINAILGILRNFKLIAP